MPVIGQTTLTGKSGTAYDFKVFTGDTRLNDFIPGVYAVVKQTAGKGGTSTVDEVLLLGASQHVDYELQNHDKRGCFQEKGYNAICLHRTANNDKLKACSEDLIAAYSPACN